MAGMDLGAWISAARRHNRGRGKMTQQELADLLSVSKQNISAWENGHHEPSYSQLLRIAEETGRPLPQMKTASTPLSAPLMSALAKLPPDELRRIENQVRAALDLDPLPRRDEPSKPEALAA